MTTMRDINIQIAWFAILLGLITGAGGVGVFFHEESWLGGYSSWRSVASDSARTYLVLSVPDF